jgi:hypothetical protein
LFKGYFPTQRKVTQIILILKPGKPSKKWTSYRSTSLLPIVSKVFEKNPLKVSSQWLKITDSYPIINLATGTGTVQCFTHQIILRINEILENKQYCSAAFLDISRQSMAYWTPIQVKTVSPFE